MKVCLETLNDLTKNGNYVFHKSAYSNHLKIYRLPNDS